MAAGFDAKRAVRVAWGMVILGVVLATGIWFEQRRVISELGLHIGQLRRDQLEVMALHRESARLAARRVEEGDEDALRRGSVAAAALRRRLDVAHSAGLSTTATPREELLPASAWTFAGQASPRDTLESVLWAATHGDVDRLAALIELKGTVRDQAAAFFAQLPESTRAQYGSPEKVFATMLAGNMPTDLSALGVVSTGGGVEAEDTATVLMRLRRESGASKDVYFNFQKGEGGWQLLIPPQILTAYEEQLSGDSPPPLALSPNRIILVPVQAATTP